MFHDVPRCSTFSTILHVFHDVPRFPRCSAVLHTSPPSSTHSHRRLPMSTQAGRAAPSLTRHRQLYRVFNFFCGASSSSDVSNLVDAYNRLHHNRSARQNSIECPCENHSRTHLSRSTGPCTTRNNRFDLVHRLMIVDTLLDLGLGPADWAGSTSAHVLDLGHSTVRHSSSCQDHSSHRHCTRRSTSS